MGAYLTVYLHGAGVPVLQGIGIGIYRYLIPHKGFEHRGLEVAFAARGKPYLVGTDEAHDEGGLLALDQTRGGLP